MPANGSHGHRRRQLPSLYPQAGSLAFSLGHYLLEAAQFIPARAAFQRALTIFQAACGPDHPNVAAALGRVRVVAPPAGRAITAPHQLR